MIDPYKLGCNAVRTSHYTQSQYFIDECDKIGLLVFTEIPGWQHIGDKEWQEVAIQNTREMVLEYRNHPSIFLWGVRINESLDNDEFYKITNSVAHSLDPTRPTSGVRYIENSSLLEDIYAYNDFSHTGKNPGVKKREKVTKMEAPLLISEANGHMFPTKAFDPWAKRQEHALRHAKVLNDALSDGEHIGCFEWCFFDYPTHKDFGSGDRVCYHGVTDSFRNFKDAAYLWSSQGEEEEVLHLSSSLDIGDYSGGVRGSIWLFTNASCVKVIRNEKEILTLNNTSPYSSLPHGPIEVNDLIGNLLETEEHFSPLKSKLVKSCLNAAGKYGINSLPLKYKLLAVIAFFLLGFKYTEAVRLYGKYVASWGSESVKWTFQGIWNGKKGKKITISPSSRLHLETSVESTTLYEGDSYDEALVRIRVLDENNNLAPYALLPLRVETEGAISHIGPDTIVLEGGMSGVIVKTNGTLGKGKLTISSQNFGQSLEFFVMRK